MIRRGPGAATVLGLLVADAQIAVIVELPTRSLGEVFRRLGYDPS